MEILRFGSSNGFGELLNTVLRVLTSTAGVWAGLEGFTFDGFVNAEPELDDSEPEPDDDEPELDEDDEPELDDELELEEEEEDAMDALSSSFPPSCPKS